ncbi:hypothetical protein CYMTET_14746 [Cymbomonas tetramitiformis]|uniref:HhH-GPD domain-containing protein n=1 Tax=Cymbomonas tetramitiformis TaxID=36881 RepID=A0AAE0GG01_9CHLO|nr:hypothetical protein CYMTET_14746 [Cymbomonas tetramitiformis]
MSIPPPSKRMKIQPEDVTGVPGTSDPTGNGASNESGLSEYELQRLEHIKRNQEFMARLGLPVLVQACAERSSAAKNSTRKAIPKPSVKLEYREEDLRRSRRVSKKPQEFSGEEVDRYGDELDELIEASVGKAERMSVVLIDSKRWLEESRKALLQVGVENNGVSDDAWQKEAQRRWGAKVSTVRVDDWQEYVRSRLSTPPRATEMELMQEFYAHDTWQLLICCALMSRVSSHNVKHNTISAFFHRFPTPSDALDAEPEEVLKIIAPLGLFPSRMRTITEVSQRFLEMPIFEIGLEKHNKVYGIGEFGYHSYLIFCRNEIAMTPSDKTLRAFVNLQRRMQCAGDNELAHGAEI